MIDVLIFAIITGLLFWKLKNILGKEDENSPPRRMKFEIKNVTGEGKNNDASNFVSNLIDLTKDGKEPKQPNIEEEVTANLPLVPEALHQNYRALCKVMPAGFLSVKNFIDGVETIFVELINSQNTKTVLNIDAFVSRDFLKFFTSFLEKQKLENPNQKIDLIKIESIKFVSIDSTSNEFAIKMEVLSEQLKYTRDGETVTSGSITIPQKFTDILTFTRNTKNNSWFLTKVE